MTDPFLDCFITQTPPPPLVPGRPRRTWMDEFPHRAPYRCLPITMANSSGWEILCPFDFSVEWAGEHNPNSLTFSSEDKTAHLDQLISSHFGGGIITFHTGYLFRTPPGWGLWCFGPPNMPKDGVAPLTGLVESDWLPFPFTMNWQMTRPGTVHFKKGECFCFITLSQHHRLETVEPVLKDLAREPALREDYNQWRDSRSGFLEKMEARDPGVLKAGWQRHYMRGEQTDGTQAPSHVTKRRMKMPVKKDYS